jgi:primosomal protein N' (replication factor Y)
MERRSGRYRFYLQIEANTRGDLQRSLNALIGTLESQKNNHTVRWSVDVDPQEA